MKQYLFLLFFVLSFFTTYCQTNQWTWMSGDNMPYQPTVYGVKGAASASASPGARYGAVSWTDPSGNLWFFGGYLSTFGKSGYTNELWKYNPSTGWWAWISGDSITNLPGSYGIKGIAASTNIPGGREKAVSWTDGSGNLWLFGGYSYGGYLNDLWKYDHTTGQWTWISGANNGFQLSSYGTKGQAGPLNVPGARHSAVSWTDASGNFWLFGGLAYAASGSGFLNDLWKFEPVTGYWTWMSGDSVVSQVGIYGVKGTPAAANKPGARYGASSWTDHSGNLWLIGGVAATSSGIGFMNDLWKYTTATGQWTWVSGDNIPNPKAVYGTKGVPAAGNKPGAQYYASTWTDLNGNLWLLEGNGGGPLVAFWKYAPAVDQWTWINANNVAFQYYGIYGTKGLADTANKPGARMYAVSWTDPAGNFWLFGGDGYGASKEGTLNDLWKYTFSGPSAPGVWSDFTAQKQQQTAVLSWATNREENARLFVIERYSAGAVYDSIGAVAAAGTTSSITHYSFIDKSPLAGTNFYRIRQTDQTGISHFSATTQVIMSEIVANFSIVQNPVQSRLIISIQMPVTQKLILEVMDMNGHLLLHEPQTGVRGGSVFTIPTDHLEKGAYLIHVQSESISSTRMFIKL